MTEKEIERILVTGVRDLGGRAYKWVSPGNAGVPDRIVIFPGQAPIFVELKTESGKLTRLQEVQIRRLQDLQQRVQVLRGEKEVRMFLWRASGRVCETIRGDKDEGGTGV